MRTLTDPDPHMRDAVEARQEIDLRIGAAFTRWQTDRLRKKFPGIEEVKQVVSYGQTDDTVSSVLCARRSKLLDALTLVLCFMLVWLCHRRPLPISDARIRGRPISQARAIRVAGILDHRDGDQT